MVALPGLSRQYAPSVVVQTRVGTKIVPTPCRPMGTTDCKVGLDELPAARHQQHEAGQSHDDPCGSGNHARLILSPSDASQPWLLLNLSPARADVTGSAERARLMDRRFLPVSEPLAYVGPRDVAEMPFARRHGVGAGRTLRRRHRADERLHEFASGVPVPQPRG